MITIWMHNGLWKPKPGSTGTKEEMFKTFLYCEELNAARGVDLLTMQNSLWPPFWPEDDRILTIGDYTKLAWLK